MDLPQNTEWNAVKYGGGLFVAVAIDKICARSSDGINWIEYEMRYTGDWRCLGYGGTGYFVTASYGNNEANWGTPGNWNTGVMPGERMWDSIAYGKGVFVACAHVSNVAAYSPTGEYWTSVTIPTGNWQDVAFGRDIFVMVGRSDEFQYSLDGKEWERGFDTPSGSWESVT